MTIEFEKAQKNLRDLIAWYNGNVNNHTRNEATTRLHLIDRLLFECLDWDRRDCKAEDHLNGKYTDYSFYCPECLFIVEAKKEGVYFELPVGLTKLKYNINYFSKPAKDVHKAITQAINYCQSRGTPYGAVCNGHQLILFIGSRSDGCPPLEGKALVFDSLQKLEENFLLVWQCISRDGIMSRRLSLELQETITAPAPEKLSVSIRGYPGFKKRNSLQTSLQILSDLFIEDIARLGANGEEQEFLRECYCQSGALSQYAAISKDILRTRYSAMFQELTEVSSITPVTTKKGLSPEFLADSLSRRPILLIGDIGVGKTMFIKHLYQVDAKDIFSEALVLYIDFGSKPTLEKELRPFIMEEIKRQFLDRYNLDIEERNFVHGVLHRDLEQLKRGIYGDIYQIAPETYRMKEVEYIEEKLRNKDEYLKSSLIHISKGHKKQVVIFLDNVDQRPNEFQESVFLIGQTMASNWPVAVFISIRPETFYRSRIAGTLSAYHPRAFTIAPPRVDEVVNKRLLYGISLLRSGAQFGLAEQIAVRAESLIDYLDVLTYSFNNNRHLIEFLDNMCGGNIRLALDFVRLFIGSGHVDTAKILRIYHETGRYLVPLHEFMRAVIYVDYEHYSPAASEILNLFEVSTPDGRMHFLMPILLAQLDNWAQHSTTDGFVHVSDIYSYLQSLGFNPYQIDWAIKRLINRNLIELPTKLREYEEDKVLSHYRITSVGAYYVKRLITRFTYIDAVIVDTPIIDPNIRAQIVDIYDLTERLERAKVFCDYLDSQWHGLSEQQLAFDWPSIRTRINSDVDYITGKISVREDVIEPA